MGDAPDMVGLELPEHLPALADDADGAIVGADKEAVGALADTGYVVALEELAGVVISKSDGRDVEEVERLPLCNQLAGKGLRFRFPSRTETAILPHRDGAGRCCSSR